MDKSIENILNRLPVAVSDFYKVNSKNNITEIRLRTGFDIRICVDGVYHTIRDTVITSEYMDTLFYSFCDNTVSAYEDQTGKGFLTLSGGHRIGLGGKFITNEKGKTVITDINSMNIRLAKFHQIKIDDKLLDFKKGLLIAGRPHSGKTTFIKNLCYRLQDKNIVVCDERNELYTPNLCCDFIINMPKELAIFQALRTLNPEYIVCDELGMGEPAAILAGVNGGAKFICSIHCNNLDELTAKPDVSLLLSAKVFDRIILLNNCRNNFYIKEIRDV